MIARRILVCSLTGGGGRSGGSSGIKRQYQSRNINVHSRNLVQSRNMMVFENTNNN
jgi:hypothetical protein